jgi:hypothetical protein
VGGVDKGGNDSASGASSCAKAPKVDIKAGADH